MDTRTDMRIICELTRTDLGSAANDFWYINSAFRVLWSTKVFILTSGEGTDPVVFGLPDRVLA